MTPERREHLIGETIKEIVNIKHELAMPMGSSQEHDAELTEMLQVQQDKLKHLRRGEIEHLEQRLEVIKADMYDHSTPGELAELHHLAKELENKINRLKKEVGNG